MAITNMSAKDGKEVVITVQGTFNFSVHEQFRAAYRNFSPTTDYIVDLRGADHLDSAALGMLLVLRKHAGADKARVRLLNANPAVQRVLDIAKFDRLFSFA